MNRAEKATLQLRAVDVLQMLKETRTYEELAADTGLPAGDLNRYVNGHVLPGPDRAKRILDDVARPMLVGELEARIKIDADGYVDNSQAVFDRAFLDLAAPVVAESFGFDRPDVVLTAATDGITLASSLARYYGTPCVYAKKRKETAVEEFIEARQRLQSGIELTYYLPAAAIDDGARVLVVDDLIRSGETQQLLLDIVDELEGVAVGVFALIAAGEEGISRARERTAGPVGALVTV